MFRYDRFNAEVKRVGKKNVIDGLFNGGANSSPNNYMKDGVLLRQVVNVTDDLEFDDYEDRHAFGEIYEKILKDLQSAGNAGEFYTPRAVTDFMAKMLNPEIGEKVADFACGTGGFLTSVLKILDEKVKTAEEGII